MSLVGYDVSSSSESETEETKPKISKTEPQSVAESTAGLNLSRVLPKPKQDGRKATALLGSSKTSKKHSIKITAPEIPILDSDDSDNESSTVPPKKKIQPSKTRSGLFAKLPAPMNAATSKHTNTSFVPYVFSKPKSENPPKKIHEKIQIELSTDSQKDNKNSSSTKTVPSIAEIRRRSTQAAAKLLSTNSAISSKDENDSDDESSASGFFSYVEKVPDDQVPEIEMPEPEVRNEPESSTVSQFDYDTIPTTHYIEGNYCDNTTHIESEHTQNEISADRNMSEFYRIQGKRNRREEINFIDINADDALEGNKEMLLKQISEEKNMNRTSHSKKKSNAPGGVLKRKHQLSYLVHQAKARELELKNSWAQNRLTKQQTQSKYGF